MPTYQTTERFKNSTRFSKYNFIEPFNRASVNGCKQKKGIIRISKHSDLEFTCGVKKVKEVSITTHKNESYVTFAGEISFRRVSHWFSTLSLSKILKLLTRKSSESWLLKANDFNQVVYTQKFECSYQRDITVSSAAIQCIDAVPGLSQRDLTRIFKVYAFRWNNINFSQQKMFSREYTFENPHHDNRKRKLYYSTYTYWADCKHR